MVQIVTLVGSKASGNLSSRTLCLGRWIGSGFLVCCCPDMIMWEAYTPKHPHTSMHVLLAGGLMGVPALPLTQHFIINSKGTWHSAICAGDNEHEIDNGAFQEVNHTPGFQGNSCTVCPPTDHWRPIKAATTEQCKKGWWKSDWNTAGKKLQYVM